MSFDNKQRCVCNEIAKHEKKLYAMHGTLEEFQTAVSEATRKQRNNEKWTAFERDACDLSINLKRHTLNYYKSNYPMGKEIHKPKFGTFIRRMNAITCFAKAHPNSFETINLTQDFCSHMDCIQLSSEAAPDAMLSVGYAIEDDATETASANSNLILAQSLPDEMWMTIFTEYLNLNNLQIMLLKNDLKRFFENDMHITFNALHHGTIILARKDRFFIKWHNRACKPSWHAYEELETAEKRVKRSRKVPMHYQP